MPGRGVKAGQVRASGKTVATEVADKEAETLNEPAGDVMDEDDDLWFGHFGLSRVRVQWKAQDKVALAQVQRTIDDRVGADFADAYAIMYELWEIVREPLADRDGVVQTDADGLIVWRQSPTGAFYEDWSRLLESQKQDFLFRITSQIFLWEQVKADYWTEAMFAKAAWQERFSHQFDSSVGGTVEDRTQAGNRYAAEERYFALFVSGLSRKADGLVKSMDSLALRLRDTLRS